MKKMTFLAAVLLAMMTVPAVAQGENVCAPREMVVESLKTEYGELVQVRALVHHERAFLELFVNPDTGSWTVTVTGVNGLACLLSSGHEYTNLTLTPRGDPL
jgi:hypothetical protein